MTILLLIFAIVFLLLTCHFLKETIHFGLYIMCFVCFIICLLCTYFLIIDPTSFNQQKPKPISKKEIAWKNLIEALKIYDNEH